MKYFINGPAGPREAARCSDNTCPCDANTLEPGGGYLYVDELAVEFREDARTLSLAQAKLERLSRVDGVNVVIDPICWTGIILCEQAADARMLNMLVAREDAAHWWRTGAMPLRATPKVLANRTTEPILDFSRGHEENVKRIATALASRSPEEVQAQLVFDGGPPEMAEEMVRRVRVMRGDIKESTTSLIADALERDLAEKLRGHLDQPIQPITGLPFGISGQWQGEPGVLDSHSPSPHGPDATSPKDASAAAWLSGAGRRERPAATATCPSCGAAAGSGLLGERRICILCGTSFTIG